MEEPVRFGLTVDEVRLMRIALFEHRERVAKVRDYRDTAPESIRDDLSIAINRVTQLIDGLTERSRQFLEVNQ